MELSCGVVPEPDPETVSSDVFSDNLADELHTLAPALEATCEDNYSEYMFFCRNLLCSCNELEENNSKGMMLKSSKYHKFK